MKYILLTLVLALIVAVTSCEHGKVELPVGNTGTDTVEVNGTTDTEDASDNEYITASDTTTEVITVMESTES